MSLPHAQWWKAKESQGNSERGDGRASQRVSLRADRSSSLWARQTRGLTSLHACPLGCPQAQTNQALELPLRQAGGLHLVKSVPEGSAQGRQTNSCKVFRGANSSSTSSCRVPRTDAPWDPQRLTAEQRAEPHQQKLPSLSQQSCCSPESQASTPAHGPAPACTLCLCTRRSSGPTVRGGTWGLQSAEAMGSHSHCILTSQGPGGPPTQCHGLMIFATGIPHRNIM